MTHTKDLLQRIPNYPNYFFNPLTQKVFSTLSHRFLKPGRNQRGDKLFVLFHSATKSYRTEYLHRITFLCANPLTPWKDFIINQVDHIDGNHLNNSPKNLRLITQQQNLEHFWKNFFVPKHQITAEKKQRIANATWS